MLVTTRKLDATETKGDRISVKAQNGMQAEYGYPYAEGLDGREAHAWAVRRLLPAPEYGEPLWIEETRGEKFRVDELLPNSIVSMD